MTSKVLVKSRFGAISQEKKPLTTNIVTLPDKNEESNQTSQIKHQSINMDKIAQLEQNMKFLQEQHQETLIALHREVESLREKNRDLQFRLLFSKGSNYLPSSPSSPEDNGTGFMKSKGSPVCVNITPLQVELLEKDLQDTKISLQAVKTQNQHLSEVIEQQKKTINSAEDQKVNKQLVTDVGIQVECKLEHVIREDLVTSLSILQAIIKRVHERLGDQTMEIAMLKAASANAASSNKGAQSRENNNSYYSRGSPTSTTQDHIPHKFPPLQSQSYWRHREPRNAINWNDKHERVSTVLSQLRDDSVKLETCSWPRGYRGHKRQMSQKDRTDTDHPHHRRDYRSRNFKVYTKKLVDSLEELREATTPSGSKS